MRGQCVMQARQLSKIGPFLEEHPDFSPLLIGDDAHVCGFQVGASYLTIDDMEALIAAQPRFDREQAASLLAPLGASK